MTLIFGMSHANCIRRAIPKGLEQRVEVVNLVADRDKLKPGTKMPRRKALAVRDPEILAFVLGGQGHNIFGLVEHTTPFAVVSQGWQARGEPPREIIPMTALRAALAERLAGMPQTVKPIRQTFPEAVVVIVNPPPPLADRDTIMSNPKLYAEGIDRGLAPDWLRVAVYAAQTEIYRDFARRSGAHFLAAPPETLTPEGLLAKPFCGQDPTHANTAYGRAMLDQILDIKRTAPWPIPPEDTPIKDFPIDSSGVPTPA